jgi:hypothetical protein
MVLQVGLALLTCFIMGAFFYNLPSLRSALDSARAYEIWDITTKLIAAVGTVSAGIAVYWKFHKEKNRQIQERRLNEVYAPLIKLLVRQETFRAILTPHISLEEAPIFFTVETPYEIHLKSGHIDIQEGEEKTGRLDRAKFVEALDKSNYGLARPRLLKLIAEYELLISLEDELRVLLKPQVDAKCVDESTIAYKRFKRVARSKVQVELVLVKEIVEGYNETVKQLGIDDDPIIIELESIKDDFELEP